MLSVRQAAAAVLRRPRIVAGNYALNVQGKERSSVSDCSTTGARDKKRSAVKLMPKYVLESCDVSIGFTRGECRDSLEKMA